MGLENVHELLIALKYLGDSGGKEIVKKAASDFYEWCKNKLTDKGKEKLEALKKEPENEDVQKETQKSLEAALELELLPPAELQNRAQTFIKMLQEKDSEWFKKILTTIKQNKQNISGTRNIGVQDVSGSEININKND